jgi:hypothetical protein
MVDNDSSSQLSGDEEFVDVSADAVEQTEEDNTEDNKQASEPEFEVPEKFAAKSKEEVAQSYTELERELGRKSNEIGELRKLTDQLLQLQVAEKQQAAQTPPAEEATPVDFDSLWAGTQQCESTVG